MPLQNRVLPNGDIVAIPARGTLTGNRGIIHRQDKTLGKARWSHHAWICCTLDWQGRKRPLMNGRNWTELFFLDEACALAAGHRPCGYCRRAAYRRFVDAWESAVGLRPKAPQMDKILHDARIVKGTRHKRQSSAHIDQLPDGTMITRADCIYLILGNRLLPYRPDGYSEGIKRPTGIDVSVLTPLPIVAVLRAGFAPALHPSVALPVG